MLIHKILNELKVTDRGIMCRSEQERKLVHKFIREAVMDRRIPVYKVTGVAITSLTAKSVYTASQIARNKQIGESYVELAVNMLDKTFIVTNNDTLTADLHVGENSLPKVQFKAYNKEAKCFYTNPKLCRVIDGNVGMKIAIERSTGYKSMAQNSETLKSGFFPCNTDFSINDFVRVLPVVDGIYVPIKFFNGFDVDMFNALLILWRIDIDKKIVNEGDKEWLYSFET